AVMSSRAFSTDPKDVVRYARGFLRGLKSAGVIGCGKHFPGLGEGDLDSHHDLPVIKKPLAKLWKEDLVPYRTMKRELPMVLINHANYPAVTRDKLPASLSKKWITEVLRRRIGYRGLIASDDLEMGGVLKAAPIEQATIEFIRAGGDLGLICHQEDYIVRAFAGLTREAGRNRKFAQRVEESSKRVLAFKKKWKPRRASAPTSTITDKLTRQLWAFSEEVRIDTLERPERPA